MFLFISVNGCMKNNEYIPTKSNKSWTTSIKLKLAIFVKMALKTPECFFLILPKFRGHFDTKKITIFRQAILEKNKPFPDHPKSEDMALSLFIKIK